MTIKVRKKRKQKERLKRKLYNIKKRNEKVMWKKRFGVRSKVRCVSTVTSYSTPFHFITS
jgi:hypothetical protein